VITIEPPPEIWAPTATIADQQEISILQRLSGGQLSLVEDDEAVEAALVAADGTLTSGLSARREALLCHPRWRCLRALRLHCWPTWLQTWLLGPRPWDPRPELGERPAQQSFAVSSHLFVHLLAAVMAVAFLSLRSQIIPLLGENGLMPALDAAERLQAVPWHRAPSVFRWIAPTDGALRGLALLGALLSVPIWLRMLPRIAIFAQVGLYLSFCSVGSPFLNFQWDNLLLELGVLALLLPMAGARLLPGAREIRGLPSPGPIGVFVMQWMLFRLLFESGCAKVLAGSRGGWLDLSAMGSYYQTVPLPTPLTHILRHLPPAFHEWETLATLVIEILLPVFIFSTPRIRAVLFVLFSGLQLGIIATGNYAFFNVLSLCLNLFLLDDRIWGLLLRGRVAPLWLRPRRWRMARTALIALPATLLVTASLVSFATFALDRKSSGPAISTLHSLRNCYAPFRIVNVYHLFASITRERVMPEIQGSNDRETWLPYRFHYAPGATDKAPRFIAPHQPRFDFQLWFLAFSKSGWKNAVARSQKKHNYHFWIETQQQVRDGSRSYFLRLLAKLQSDPAAVSALLAHNPFPNAPPTYLRVVFYDYTLADPKTRRETGEWWIRGEPMLDESVLQRQAP